MARVDAAIVLWRCTACCAVSTSDTPSSPSIPLSDRRGHTNDVAHFPSLDDNWVVSFLKVWVVDGVLLQLAKLGRCKLLQSMPHMRHCSVKSRREHDPVLSSL